MEKIYVDFERPARAKEFVKKLFTYKEYGRSKRSCIATYHDKECRVQQCNEGKYRTFTDFHKIIKTYYPTYTKKMTMNLLLDSEITYENTTYKFFPVWCSIIKNHTFEFRNIMTSEHKYWYRDNIDRHWNRKSPYTKLTWNKLFNLVGIKNLKDYEKRLQIS